MRVSVLWVIAAVEVILWLVGVIRGQMLGGFLNILLLLAALAAVTELALRYRRSRLDVQSERTEAQSSRPAA